MRKLLLGTTALAAAATISASSALANPSIAGYYEWKYNSRGSDVAALDGTQFLSDSEIAFTFSNKTDSGLDISATFELASDTADGTIDEASMTISGGFGRLVLGENDGVGDSYGVAESDIIAEDEAPTQVSASVGTTSDIGMSDADGNKISYHIPATGGFTAGVNFTNAGEEGTADSRGYGARYVMDAGGNTVTVGAAKQLTENTVQDVDTFNMGVRVDSGNASFIVSQGESKSNDEDVSTNGLAVSYKLADGTQLGAYTVDSDDEEDADEEYSRTGVEVQYTIASGLTAYINVDNYEYKTGTSESTIADKGTNSKLTIKGFPSPK
jgi:hypothetical protein